MDDAVDDAVTEAHLRAENFRPDPDNPGEWAVRFDGAMDGEHNSLVYCLSDGSVSLECFDDGGNTLEVLSVGARRTVGELRELCRALRAWTAGNWREGVTRPKEST